MATASYSPREVSVELEAEHARLKKMYAEERLKADVLKEAIEKVVRPSQRRELAIRAVKHRALTVKAACAAFGVSETCYRYQAKSSAEKEVIADWLNT